MSEQAKEKTARRLFLLSLIQSFSSSLSMQASNQIWLDHFNGDFAAHARVMTRVSMFSSIFGFFVKPLIASATDRFGRKPLLFLSPAMQFVLKLGMCLAPSHRLVVFQMAQYLLGSVTYESAHIATDAAYGDMYADQPEKLSKVISRQMITYSLSSLICPIIGGWLAQRHLRLPFVITAALYGVNGLLFVPQVPETIPDSKRTSRLSIAGASPLSAVKLFTRGARLRKVALLQIVHSFGSNNCESAMVCPSHLTTRPV